MSKTYEEMQKRVHEALGLTKAGGEPKADTEAVTGLKDPAHAGEKTPPKHPEGDNPKEVKRPAHPTNKDDTTEQEDQSGNLSVADTGKDVPSTENGNAKEEAAKSPTTPISKIAGIRQRLDAVLNNKPATDKPTAKPAAEPKKAGEGDATLQDMTPSDDVLRKIALRVISTEKGAAFVTDLFREDAGEESARELVKSAAEQQRLITEALQQEELYKQAAYNRQLQLQALWQEYTKNASEEDIKKAILIERTHTKIASTLEYDFEKAAYGQGVEDAAMMQDMMAGGEEIPGEAPQPSIQEIEALLMQAVQAGEITEEEAMQLLAELEAAQGGGAEGMSEEDLAMMANAEKAASAVTL